MVDQKPVDSAAQKPSARVEEFDEESDDDDVLTPFHDEVYVDTPADQPAGQSDQTASHAAEQPKNEAGEQPVVQAVAPDGPVKGDKTVVNDRAEAAAKENELVDPYESIDRAQNLASQLDVIEKLGVRPGENQDERVKQLKTEIAKEIELAKKGADAIRMKGTATNPGIDDIAKMNTVDRDRLCKELGLNPETISLKTLGEEYRKAGGDQAKKTKIKELGQVLADRDALSRLHFAPLTVRLVEAEFRSRGLLDPTVKLKDEVPDRELKQAFDVLNSVKKPGNADDLAAFGDGKEIREAKEVFETSERTLAIMQMFQQKQRAESIAAELNAAKTGQGDPEQHFKNAVKLADSQKVSWLAGEAHKEDNKKSDVSQELIDIVREGSTARLEYSEYLVSQGRFHEAQGLMAQVKSDSPELLFEKKGDRIEYRKHPDGKTYENLDRAVNLGLTVNPVNFEIAQNLLFDRLGQDKLGTANDGNNFINKLKDGTFKNDADVMKHLNSDTSTATECLKMMKLCREQYKKDMAAANQVLDQEVQKLDAQKKTFENRQLTKEEEIDKARIERTIASLQLTRQEREQYGKRIDALTDFTEGLVHLSQNGAKSAHTLFASALEKDPSLDQQLAQLKAGNPDMKTLSELSKMTDSTLSGYWERNYKKFAVAGAAIAGTLTGVGLIGACGYVGAGVTTTAVVATTGGAFAGGASHWGIHRSVNENAGWPEFRDGAKIGWLSSALVVSPWAAQLGRAKLGADAAVQTSAIGNLAAKSGITRNMLAGSLAASYTFEGGNVYFQNKPISKAATDGTKEAVFNSLMLGISRNWGLPSEGGAIKQAMFTRQTIGTGFGLAAAPEAISVVVDGKPLDKATRDTLVHGVEYTALLGFSKKLHVTDPAKVTGLSRFGLNKWTVGGGATMAGAPELKNYFMHGKSGEKALQDFGTNAALDIAALAVVKKYGLSDHGTGSRVAMPTSRDVMSYGARSFAMQESWNIAVSRGTKQIFHDLMREPYYIKEHGSGFVAPIVADFFDSHYGEGLDPSHPGDRKVIRSNLNGLNGTLNGSLFVDKVTPDPLRRPHSDGNDDKKGLFVDYSKPKKP